MGKSENGWSNLIYSSNKFKELNAKKRKLSQEKHKLQICREV